MGSLDMTLNAGCVRRWGLSTTWPSLRWIRCHAGGAEMGRLAYRARPNGCCSQRRRPAGDLPTASSSRLVARYEQRNLTDFAPRPDDVLEARPIASRSRASCDHLFDASDVLSYHAQLREADLLLSRDAWSLNLHQGNDARQGRILSRSIRKSSRARYPTGKKVTDEQMACFSIERDAFHGEWNYSLSPRTDNG